MTRVEAAQIWAQESGWDEVKCLNGIKMNTKAWRNFKAKHPEIIIQRAGSSGSLDVTDARDGITFMLESNWQSIQALQEQVSVSIIENPNQLKALTGALKDLQGAYIQLSEIKKRSEDRNQEVIKREAVEGIVNEVFPQLRTALDEMHTNVKLILPPNMRAEYEKAFQASVGPYQELLETALDTLNDYLE